MTGYLRHTTPTSTTAWLVGGHLSEWGTFIGPYPPSPYSHGVIYMPWESDEGEESPFLVVRYEGWTVTPPKQEETTVSNEKSEEMVNISVPRRYVEALRTDDGFTFWGLHNEAEMAAKDGRTWAAVQTYAIAEALEWQKQKVTLDTPPGTIVEHVDPEEHDDEDEYDWVVIGPGRMLDGRRSGFLVVRIRDWDEYESMDPEGLRVVKEAPNENEETIDDE